MYCTRVVLRIYTYCDYRDDDNKNKMCGQVNEHTNDQMQIHVIRHRDVQIRSHDWLVGLHGNWTKAGSDDGSDAPPSFFLSLGGWGYI